MTDLHNSVHTLSGAKALEKDSKKTFDIVGKGQTCGSTRQTPYMTGFQYDERNIPDVLRASVAQASQWYVDGARWLFSFDATECIRHGNNNTSWDDISGKRDYKGTPVLWWIGAGTNNEHYTQTFPDVCPDYGWL